MDWFFPTLLNILILAAFVALVWFIVSRFFVIVQQYEQGLLFRLGKFRDVAQPGLSFLIPFIDSVQAVDLRTQSLRIKADSVLTRDTVAVAVDAVLFWRVMEPKSAVLSVEDYADAIKLSAQSALRDAIGMSDLSGLLSNRQEMDQSIALAVGAKAAAWGLEVSSLEIRDVQLPKELGEAMSRKAQAERESEARAIYGNAEMRTAQAYVDAAAIYDTRPTALHLRGMNMLYEGMKEKGAMVVVPSSAVETMGLGAVSSLATVAKASVIAEGQS